MLQVLDTKVRASLRHVTRWFNTIVNQKEMSGVLGKVELCVKEATFLPAAGGKKRQRLKGEGSVFQKNHCKLFFISNLNDITQSNNVYPENLKLKLHLTFSQLLLKTACLLEVHLMSL